VAMLLSSCLICRPVVGLICVCVVYLESDLWRRCFLLVRSVGLLLV
jgi:hypothetical protein